MKVYYSLPDDPQFRKQTHFDLIATMVTGFVVAYVLVAIGTYELFTWMDKQASKKIIDHIEQIGK